MTVSHLLPDNDPYEAYDPVTPIRQRQQHNSPPSPPQPTHLEATVPGIYLSPRLRSTSARARAQKIGQQELTNDFEDDLGSSTPLGTSSEFYNSPESDRRPHRALHISKNTASAILYTLEEALRHPRPFTIDPVEEYAQMSDLVGGGYSSANSRAGNGADLGRPVVPPPLTGSPSGVRGPRAIMEERKAREARRKELQEKEDMERARAEQEARLLDEQRRKSAERRANAAAGAAYSQRDSGETGPRVSGGTTGQRISDNSQRSERRSGDRVSGGEQNQALSGVGHGGSAIGGGAIGSLRPRSTQPGADQRASSRNRPTAQTQDPSNPQQPLAQTSQPTQRPRANTTSQEGPIQDPTASGQAGREPTTTTRSSFPHAFERWETLSAHWEGLTSFWIRRLEENSREIARDPLSQQLSRQVTDLSAAGANLFHAVVELQRLRASSERKFQRWFFETRAEQERSQEIQAVLQGSLEKERAARVAAENSRLGADNARTDADGRIAELEARLARGEGRKDTSELQARNALLEQRLTEMGRELQISKDEARRAWEELGRQEQVERERTASLRDGLPTMLGGVQVVPMTQGVSTRQNSTRDRPATKEGNYSQTAPTFQQGGEYDSPHQQHPRSKIEPEDPFLQSSMATSAEPQVSPSVTSSGAGYVYAPPVKPVTTSDLYPEQYETSHPSQRDQYDRRSDGGLSDQEYEIDESGHFRLDSMGRKIRYAGPASDADTDEYDVTSDREREIAHAQRYGQPATSGGGSVTSGPAEPDYAGQGYGSGPGWEGVPRNVPVHTHPTRLSDVIEEDERSRTSASQLSRRNY